MSGVVLWFCALAPDALPGGVLEGLRAQDQERLCAIQDGESRRLRSLAWSMRNRLLAQQMSCRIEDLVFAHGPSGQPQVEAGPCFSLSHTPGAVLLAVADQPVGVDVESLGRRADWSRIAPRMFAPLERPHVFAQGEPIHERALSLWTAREAWCKAHGWGVAGMAEKFALAWRDGRWMPDQGDLVLFQRAGFQCALALPQAREPATVDCSQIRFENQQMQLQSFAMAPSV